MYTTTNHSPFRRNFQIPRGDYPETITPSTTPRLALSYIFPLGQSPISHHKVTIKVCRNLWDFVGLCSDSHCMFMVNFTTKFVVITTNFYTGLQCKKFVVTHWSQVHFSPQTYYWCHHKLFHFTGGLCRR